ncbi:MAG: hypothetical protein KJ626_00130 [Verrucomicrobia bacterium]|nr:hypothetical protein [Verrucomicrobiota bacterium]
MALLAEEIVEEWLNRQGWFTIRGIKLGVHEIDLLAIKPDDNGLNARHVEVQASINPSAYFGKLPKEVCQNTGQSPNSRKKRSKALMRRCLKDWVDKKFEHPRKKKLMKSISDTTWTRELVLHKVFDETEVEILEKLKIRIHRFDKIVEQLSDGRFDIKGASGTHLVDLMLLGESTDHDSLSEE